MAYSKKVIDESKEKIINKIIEGNSLWSIVDSDDEIPSIRTVFNWLNPESDNHDSEFLHNYAHATEVRSDREFEEIKTIADDQKYDVYIDEDGKEQTNHNVINRARLRVDARKWRIGRMMPKKYGDRIQVDQTTKEILLTEEELNNELARIKAAKKGS